MKQKNKVFSNIIQILCIYLISHTPMMGQDSLNTSLSFDEYLGYVKQHHPLVKQAQLKIDEGTASLLKARGGFDPKLEADYDRKKFKGTEYYDELNATFKIPTWFGVEFKANFEENTGVFLNPRQSVPDGGLYSAGVTISMARGLLINDRMAALKKARFFVEQTKAERDLLVTEVLFEASIAYFEWLEASNEEQIFNQFLDNAQIRFNGVVRSIEAGDKAAIDSVEAKIAFENRKLSLENARLKRQKAALKASNFLWINDIPLEIEDAVRPQDPSNELLASALYLEGQPMIDLLLESHPKLKAMSAKIKGLEVERSLKRNKLLPQLDLSYNFLSPDGDQINSFNTANYKAGVTFRFPLFLRKERGDVKLAQLKVNNQNLARSAETLSIRNKLEAIRVEMASLDTQNNIIGGIVNEYQTLMRAEERKFELGESSLFLINSREQKLIESTLKSNSLRIKGYQSRAKMYQALGRPLGYQKVVN